MCVFEYLQHQLLITLGLCWLTVINAQISEDEMKIKLNVYDRESKSYCNSQAKANWDVQTDIGNKEKEQTQVR